MSESPSCSKIGLSASVTIPPAQGPQLKETTRQLRKAGRLLLCPLVENSLAAAYATWPARPNRAVDEEKSNQGSEADRSQLNRLCKSLDLGPVDQSNWASGLIDDLAVCEHAGCRE